MYFWIADEQLFLYVFHAIGCDPIIFNDNHRLSALWQYSSAFRQIVLLSLIAVSIRYSF